MGTATHAYIGRHPVCRHIRAVTVDDDDPRPEHKYSEQNAASTRAFVDDLVRSGYVVERIPVKDVRNHPDWVSCPVCDERKRMELANKENATPPIADGEGE